MPGLPSEDVNEAGSSLWDVTSDATSAAATALGHDFRAVALLYETVQSAQVRHLLVNAMSALPAAANHRCACTRVWHIACGTLAAATSQHGVPLCLTARVTCVISSTPQFSGQFVSARQCQCIGVAGCALGRDCHGRVSKPGFCGRNVRAAGAGQCRFHPSTSRKLQLLVHAQWLCHSSSAMPGHRLCNASCVSFNQLVMSAAQLYYTALHHQTAYAPMIPHSDESCAHPSYQLQ